MKHKSEHTHVLARVEASAALPYDDVARGRCLACPKPLESHAANAASNAEKKTKASSRTVRQLHAEALARSFAAVLRRAGSLFRGIAHGAEQRRPHCDWLSSSA